jgi:hypothetical protein
MANVLLSVVPPKFEFVFYRTLHTAAQPENRLCRKTLTGCIPVKLDCYFGHISRRVRYSSDEAFHLDLLLKSTEYQRFLYSHCLYFVLNR